jgi:coenzyme F420-0:L-glutamate ligase / coenzyme F420-1:gamma-L-glutamate ligase
MSGPAIRFGAIDGFPEVRAGDDLGALVADALQREPEPLADRDVIVVAQKIVSKAEGRLVPLADVDPGDRARELAVTCRKDPRLVELVLRESTEVVRCVPDILIVRHRLGFVVANAGVDQSNVEGDGAQALLLPVDPDASAARLCDAIARRLGVRVGVVVSDSFGRPWRMGVTGTCIGCAGLARIASAARCRSRRLLRETPSRRGPCSPWARRTKAGRWWSRGACRARGSRMKLGRSASCARGTKTCSGDPRIL